MKSKLLKGKNSNMSDYLSHCRSFCTDDHRREGQGGKGEEVRRVVWIGRKDLPIQCLSEEVIILTSLQVRVF